MACLSPEAFEWNLKCSGLLVGVALGVSWGLLCTAFCIVRLYSDRTATPPEKSRRSGVEAGGRTGRCSTYTEPKKAGVSWSKCDKSCKADRLGKPTVVVEDLPPSRYLNESASLWRLSQLDDRGIVSSGGISYTVTERGMVVNMGAAQASPIIGRLDVGANVTIVELIEAKHVKLGRVLRGRIMEPHGWITLESSPGKEARSIVSDDSTATPQGSSLASSSSSCASSSSGISAASADGSSQTSLSSTCGASGPLDCTIMMSDEPLTRLPPRSPCCAPGRRQREEDPRAPWLLSIVSPNGQSHCEGTYELLRGRRANGKPVWRQQSGGNWLYACPAGRWCVGGEDVERADFSQNLGWITQSRSQSLSDMEMPDVSRTQWMRWDGTDFKVDAEIRVSSTPGATAAVEAISVAESQSSEPPLQPPLQPQKVLSREEAQRSRHIWFSLQRLRKASLRERCGPLDLRGAADADECRRQMQASRCKSVVI